MISKTIVYLLTGISILFTETLFAQDSVSNIIPKKYDKIVSVSLGGPLFFYSINHAWVVKEKPKSSLLVQWNLGYWWNNSDNFQRQTYKEQYFASAFSLIKQFGAKSSHFSLGIGHGFLFSKEQKHGSYDPEVAAPINMNFYNLGYLFGDIGYTYWNPNRRFYFKFSFIPILDYQRKVLRNSEIISERLLPWFSLNFGYNYTKGLKLHFLENQNICNKKKVSLSIGFENTLGYSQISVPMVGEGEGIATSNLLSLTYLPSRIFFKIKAGNTLIGYKKVTNSTGKELTIFTQLPSYWNWGFAVGYELLNIKGWQLCPEIGAGTYELTNIKYKNEKEYPGIELSETIDYFEYQNFDKTSYFSSALYLKRPFSSNFEFIAGFQYKTSDFIKIWEYNMLLAINYKFL